MCSTFFAVSTRFRSIERPRLISRQHSPQINFSSKGSRSSLSSPRKLGLHSTSGGRNRPQHITHLWCLRGLQGCSSSQIIIGCLFLTKSAQAFAPAQFSASERDFVVHVGGDRRYRCRNVGFRRLAYAFEGGHLHPAEPLVFIAATPQLDDGIVLAVLCCHARRLRKQVRHRPQARHAHGGEHVDLPVLDGLHGHHLHFPPRVFLFPGELALGPPRGVAVGQFVALRRR